MGRLNILTLRAQGVQPATASQRLGLSAAGAGGQITQVPGPEFYTMEWTRSWGQVTMRTQILVNRFIDQFRYVIDRAEILYQVM